jgi:hypothetical protein
MDSPAPFFVVGSDRSGSTMLRLMLNEHTDLFVPAESHFFSLLMDSLPLNALLSRDQLAAAYDVIIGHPRWADLPLSNEDCLEIVYSLEKPRLAALIDALFAELAHRAGKQRWGDKTPNYILEIDRLRELFPKAQFIHIIRDGRDVCTSLLGKGWRGTSPSGIGRYWSFSVGTGIQVGRSLPEGVYCEVSYEDLVLDTEKTLRELCKFLHIPFQSNMLRFYENAAINVAQWQMQHHEKTLRPPQQSDVYRWKTEAAAFQIIAFEAFAGNTMDAVGQRRRFRGIFKILPLTYAFGESVVRRVVHAIWRSGIQESKPLN